MRDILTNFERKHPEGFTNLELEELLKQFPTINVDKFYSALFGNTCMVIDDEIINYPWDVEVAISCGLSNRDINNIEFD
jgi:hypothetical protein